MSALRQQCISTSELSERARLIEGKGGERKAYEFPADWLPLTADCVLELPKSKQGTAQRDSLPLVALSVDEENAGEKAIPPFARLQLVLLHNGKPAVSISRKLRKAALVYLYADGTVFNGDLRLEPKRAKKGCTLHINLGIWAPHTASALAEKEAALAEALQQRPHLVSVSLRESVSASTLAGLGALPSPEDR